MSAEGDLSPEPAASHPAPRRRPDRVMLGLVLAGLALRFALTLSAWPNLEKIVTDDALEYRRLSENLWRWGKFSKSEAPPHVPDTLRTPLYSLLIAPWIAAAGGGSLGPLFLFQAVAQLAFFYWFCRSLQLWGASRGVARTALAILAFEPLQILYPNYLLTDLTFTILFWIGAILYLGPQGAAPSTKGRALLAGFAWGIAALTRPVGVYFIVPAAALTLVLSQARGGKKEPSRPKSALFSAVLLIAGFSLPVGLWCARNTVQTGRWMVSEIGQVNLYYYRAAGVRALQTGRELAEVQEEFRLAENDWFRDRPDSAPARREYYRSRAVEILASDPAAAARITLRGAAATMLGRCSPGYAELWGIEFRGLRRGFAEIDGARSVAVLALAALDYAWVAAALVFGLIGLGLVRRSGIHPGAYGLLLLAVAYFLALTSGPESYSRFRLPLSPAWAVFAALGLEAARRRWGGARGPRAER